LAVSAPVGATVMSSGSVMRAIVAEVQDGRVRAVVQCVSSASVVVDGAVVGALGSPGLLVYVGITHTDGAAEADWLARKVWDLRILRDEQSASDVGAPVLVVSQFTLYGDARKGRRPTWQAAAPGPVSEPLYDAFCAALMARGAHVERGVFGAHMQVESVNEGPFTVLLER
jgi:D-tyrosyl-tRNA(Tyr) deacylase